MSENKIVLEGPSGIYEIPEDVLAKYRVPGTRVAELRERMGKAAAAAPANGDGKLPAGHFRAPPPSASPAPIVLNIYVGGATPSQVQIQPAAPAQGEAGIEGYHMALDEQGIPHNHTEMLWGEYIDKFGRAAVGFHSHDPVSGNAR